MFSVCCIFLSCRASSVQDQGPVQECGGVFSLRAWQSQHKHDRQMLWDLWGSQERWHWKSHQGLPSNTILVHVVRYIDFAGSVWRIIFVGANFHGFRWFTVFGGSLFSVVDQQPRKFPPMKIAAHENFDPWKVPPMNSFTHENFHPRKFMTCAYTYMYSYCTGAWCNVRLRHSSCHSSWPLQWIDQQCCHSRAGMTNLRRHWLPICFVDVITSYAKYRVTLHCSASLLTFNRAASQLICAVIGHAVDFIIAVLRRQHWRGRPASLAPCSLSVHHDI